MSTTDPIRNAEQIAELCDYFRKKKSLRDYVLITMGLNSALRISDMLSLRWGNVYDFEKECFMKHITVIEKKTGKRAKIAISEKLKAALCLYRLQLGSVNPLCYIFASQKGTNSPIERTRAYRIIKNASNSIGIDGNISCHSLRKTFGYHAYKQGYPLALIMNVFNHSSIDVLKRYLCIDQDEKDELYLNLFK